MSCNENQFRRKLENLEVNNTNMNEHNKKIEELVNNYRTSKSSDHLKNCETNLRDVKDDFSNLKDGSDILEISTLQDKVVSMCQSVSAEKSKCENLICDKEIYSQSQCENKSILDSFFNLFDIFGDISEHKTKITKINRWLN